MQKKWITSVSFLITLLCSSLLCFSTCAIAEGDTTEGKSIQYAKGEELAVAIGHFSKARALLITALNEFDTGCKHANPEVLINVEAWRNTLIDRTEDIEKVLAPQARSTKHGVQYQPDSRLVDTKR